MDWLIIEGENRTSPRRTGLRAWLGRSNLSNPNPNLSCMGKSSPTTTLVRLWVYLDKLFKKLCF